MDLYGKLPDDKALLMVKAFCYDIDHRFYMGIDRKKKRWFILTHLNHLKVSIIATAIRNYKLSIQKKSPFTKKEMEEIIELGVF